MVQFAEAFPDEGIVVTLSRQLCWSHFSALLPLNQPLQREFHAEMSRIEGWSVRTLRERIDSMLYERTAFSKQPDSLIRQELAVLRSHSDMTPRLSSKTLMSWIFWGCRPFLERDLEDAILRELETFLLELGAGFSFVARQKRIQLDGDDFYIDLLFYNRKLKRLVVVVELKQGSFKPEYKCQMELYLRWLAQNEREPGENLPLGIILCAGKNSEQIELLELGAAGIHVAEYLTVLPPPEVLRVKLHEAIEMARTRIRSREEKEMPEPPGKGPPKIQT